MDELKKAFNYSGFKKKKKKKMYIPCHAAHPEV